MPEGRTYTIRKILSKNEAVPNKTFFLKPINSAIDGCLWGRLHIRWQHNGRMNIKVMAMALDDITINLAGKTTEIDSFLSDKDVDWQLKEELFIKSGGISSENQTDCLLYKLEGKYLWIGIIMEGEGSGNVDYIKVYQKGDNFMDTFPEVYHERNSFFHRYLSIFSTIYNDFQWDIEHIHEIFNPDTAPVALLPVFAEWMGLDVRGDFLEEEVLRAFIKEAYGLCRIKGTKRAMERAAQIILGEKAIILEKCKMEEYKKKNIKDECDIVLLIKTSVPQEQKAKLKFLLEQFKPIGCTMRILFLRKSGRMDSHTYMDINAVISDAGRGYLDKGQICQNIILG